MGIQIADKEAEALVAELEAATGKDAETIVLDLLRKEVALTRRQRKFAPAEMEARRRSIEEAAERYSARLPPNPPHPDDIIGYDENGLPT